MNSGPLLFLGAFFTLASSFWGLLLVPQLQLGRQEQVSIKPSGEMYPPTRGGQAAQGAIVYRAQGCAECHTQQVRPKGEGADYERAWGRRRSVAQDYIGDYPVLLGQQRVGPDLANIGLRSTDVATHLKHLYNPQLTAPGSMMPPYSFLFEKNKLVPGQRPSPDALPADTSPGDEIVPKPEAQALVAYLLSLRADVPLFEAPFPVMPTNAPVADASATNAIPTNAPVATPNAPK
jgi:cytochrome c oxidase cbb3-type subunit 2